MVLESFDDVLVFVVGHNVIPGHEMDEFFVTVNPAEENTSQDEVPVDDEKSEEKIREN